MTQVIAGHKVFVEGLPVIVTDEASEYYRHTGKIATMNDAGSVFDVEMFDTGDTLTFTAEHIDDLSDDWLISGHAWVNSAVDPVFNAGSFTECKTVDELIDKFRRGNWSLGTAFWYEDLCFINQVNGGDEWLTIRKDIAFDSVSCRLIIMKYGSEGFKDHIRRYKKATDEQLRNLEY